jgi:hypothetical protein
MLSLQLEEMATLHDAMKALGHISENANKAVDVPISENENDRMEAERSFQRSVQRGHVHRDRGYEVA